MIDDICLGNNIRIPLLVDSHAHADPFASD
jgi:hypothetical protein